MDFDGLVLDTESSAYDAWCWAYARYGETLPRDRWCETIGTDGPHFDPLEVLKQRIGARLETAELEQRRRSYRDRLLEDLEPLPGVVPWLEQARQRGLGVAIASSSTRDWVRTHLERLNLLGYFDVLATADDVSRVKPAPELYLHATSLLDVLPTESIAVEDSPNGTAAAAAAGLFCVAVPGPMTRDLRFEAVDLMLKSLEERRLSDVIEEVESAAGPVGGQPRPE